MGSDLPLHAQAPRDILQRLQLSGFLGPTAPAVDIFHAETQALEPRRGCIQPRDAKAAGEQFVEHAIQVHAATPKNLHGRLESHCGVCGFSDVSVIQSS